MEHKWRNYVEMVDQCDFGWVWGWEQEVVSAEIGPPLHHQWVALQPLVLNDDPNWNNSPFCRSTICLRQSRMSTVLLYQKHHSLTHTPSTKTKPKHLHQNKYNWSTLLLFHYDEIRQVPSQSIRTRNNKPDCTEWLLDSLLVFDKRRKRNIHSPIDRRQQTMRLLAATLSGRPLPFFSTSSFRIDSQDGATYLKTILIGCFICNL